jgi:ABC-type transport system substrate-binding protein
MVPTPRSLHVALASALLVLLSSIAGGVVASATPVAGPTVIEAVSEASVATPRGEQRLRITGPIDPVETLDPALARDVTATAFSRLLFRGLTRLDDALMPVPELAERIEISPDGRTYRFVLRETAAFHDGRPLLAADVVASLTRSLSPRTAGGDVERLSGPTYLSDIDGAAEVISGQSETLRGARVIDDRSLEIRLTERGPPF